FVEDGNLTVNVFALRKALAEGLNGASPIETVPKRGYRFIAPVEETVPEAVAAPAREIPKAAAGETGHGDGAVGAASALSTSLSWKRLAVAGAAVAGLAAILAWLLLLRSRQPEASGPAGRISLAVLPFQNLTGKPVYDYLSNSLAEEVITRLARDYAHELRVIARDSATSYAARHVPLPRIAAELRAQYLIGGTVRSDGNHVRVSAQLIRASDQTSLWADSYDGDASRLFEFEDNVAQSVARQLSLKLLAGRPRDYAPTASAAYDDYLHGLYFLSRRSKTSLQQALESFAAATVSDPRYARAYAGLAVTYDLLGGYSWVSPGYAHSLGRAAAAQAIAADPALGEAHAALGFSEWFYEWNLPGAEQEFRRAIELDPDNADAHHWYSQALMTGGRFREAEHEMRAALELDPRSLILRTNLGWLHYFERNYPLAIEEIQRVALEAPDFVTAHYKLWEAYSMNGNKANAWNECRQLAHQVCSPEDEKKILDAYQQGGYSSALKSLVTTSPGDYSGSYVDGSRYLIFAGDKARALDFLERAYHDKDGWLIFVPIDPAFDSLRSDPRFDRLMQQLPPAS
ncbi:MAG TPA: tetratricopeptide repeat protein, partial [Spirochaetia bacterium]|nr:tetratricopeptide repeat protein [Spirochaetia bacterium]